MPGPNVFVGGVGGLPASVTDYNNNWGLVESSFLDLGPFVISGLVPSAGTSLSVNVTAGVALIGAQVTAASSFVIGSLTPSTTNYLYLLQNGTGTSNTSGTPPANSVRLGTCVTGAGSVTSVADGRTSGRQQWVAPYGLIPGGPASGLTSAGHPGSINLAGWAASAGEGVPVYGVLPAGAISAAAGFTLAPIATKTTTYTVLSTDRTLRADATSGAFTVTLLDATSVAAGFVVIVKKIDATANTVTLATTGGQTIDGSATYPLSAPQQAVSLYSTGSQWEVW